MILTRLLRQSLAESGLTQEKLAAELGLTKSCVSRKLNGSRRMNEEFFVAAASAIEKLTRTMPDVTRRLKEVSREGVKLSPRSPRRPRRAALPPLQEIRRIALLAGGRAVRDAKAAEFARQQKELRRARRKGKR